ncbi:thioredoxin family protein [Caminibacter pacificus]
MRKFLALALFVVSVFAFEWSGKVTWAMNYQLAKQLAQKEHKLIMVDIALTKCPPCRYLATKVYTDDKVANYINQNFVPVFYLADQDQIPAEVEAYFTGSTPTILFIKPNGELYFRMIGARPPQMFLKILKDVNEKYKGAK